jgi:hypothetical protein
MSRKVIHTVLIEKTGLRKNIYEVNNPLVDTGRLVQGQKYLVEYRLLNKEKSNFMLYLEATEDFRTLIFQHPTEMFRTIGIPLMNINFLTEVD